MYPANTNSVKLKKSSSLFEGFNLKEKISVWIYPVDKKNGGWLQAPDLFCISGAKSITWESGRKRMGDSATTDFADK